MQTELDLALEDAVRRDGFAFLRAEDMRALLAAHGSLADWDAFAHSWSDLPVDTYMADGGRYRRRRHATFAAGPAGIVRAPHQPHFQSRDYNSLNGGIERWFAPIEPAVAAGATMTTLLHTCRSLFDGLTDPPATTWHIELHQFRIEALPGQPGQPTPEGRHRDGVDHVLVLLVNRVNIERGRTTIQAPDGTELGAFTLTTPLDAAWVEDRRVFHGVTAVEATDPARPAHRDVLVMTFRRA